MTQRDDLRQRRLRRAAQKYATGPGWRWSFLLPGYWPLWLLSGFLFVAGRLPFKAFVLTGKTIGWLLMPLLKRRRRIAARNLELCFPQLSARERKRLLRKTFQFAGVALLEPGLVWFVRRRRFDRLHRVEGLEHLNRLRETGVPVLLCALHMQCLEVMGRIISRFLPVNQMYRVNNNALLEYISCNRRLRYHFRPKLIPRKNLKDFLLFLANGECGSVIPDHDLGRSSGLFVPFFGHQAATAPVVSVCAGKTGAHVLMMDFYLDGRAGCYVLRLRPVPPPFPCGDRYADTEQINRLTEEIIREHPEQYLWMHRRFKTRPDPGDAPLY